ncbi:MAG TPA: hypothetical protein VKB50_13100 [Vicinamibacterales bacterium]|nr:hypothetical protein [Vicinamibacterales bacterium]
MTRKRRIANHSLRSASSGSMLASRRVSIQQASRATPANSRPSPMSVGASVGVTSKRKAVSPRERITGGDDARHDAARDQAERVGEHQAAGIALLCANSTAHRNLATSRRDRQRQHAVHTDERQHAGDDREPDEQLHREHTRGDRIVADLLERARFL